MMRFPKNDRVLTVGLNVLIGVLLSAVFLQCGVFLQRYAQIRSGEEEMPFNMRMLSSSGQEGDRALQADLLLPAEIVMSKDGTARAVVNSSAVIGDLYEELAGTVAACFAETPKPETETVWKQTVTSSDVIYIRYHEPLPYQILHAFAAAMAQAEGSVRNADSVHVSELCLRLSGRQANLLVRGADGVFSFTAASAASVAVLYNYTQTYQDVFYPCILRYAEEGCAVLLTERVAAREIQIVGSSAGLIAGNEAYWKTWLRGLRFNPDKLNYHTEPDGAAVYVESHGVLRCGADEILYTAAENGGIPVEAFCTPAEADIYTYLRAASAWIAKMTAADFRCTGGDAVPQLTAVLSDGTSVTLRFGLYLDNLPLYYGGVHTVISVTFTDDAVTELLWRPVYVSRYLTEERVFLEEWACGALQSEDVRLAYRADPERQIIGAEWIAHRTAEE